MQKILMMIRERSIYSPACNGTYRLIHSGADPEDAICCLIETLLDQNKRLENELIKSIKSRSPCIGITKT